MRLLCKDNGGCSCGHQSVRNMKIDFVRELVPKTLNDNVYNDDKYGDTESPTNQLWPQAQRQGRWTRDSRPARLCTEDT